MGAELAKLVALCHGDLDGNAFKVLNRMAWTALDRPNNGRPARLYFAGWEPLAMALGHELPHGRDDSPEAERARRRLQKYVSTAIKKLAREDVRAIERLNRAGFGTRQTYRLLVDLTTPHSVGSNSTPVSGVQSTPASGRQQHPMERVESTPLSGVPRKEQDSMQDLSEDRTSHLGLSSHLAPNPRQPHAFPEGLDDCDRCTLPPENAIHRSAS